MKARNGGRKFMSAGLTANPHSNSKVNVHIVGDKQNRKGMISSVFAGIWRWRREGKSGSPWRRDARKIQVSW